MIYSIMSIRLFAPTFTINTDKPDSYRKLPEAHLKVLLYKREPQPFIFSYIKRDPRARVISLSYIGLMNETESKTFDNSAEWFTVCQKNERLALTNGVVKITNTDLGFDHYNIFKTALERLKSKTQYSPIAFHLLPETFTLTELQNVYEIIQNKKRFNCKFPAESYVDG